MKLSKLELENFREYQTTAVNFEDNLTVLFKYFSPVIYLAWVNPVLSTDFFNGAF